MTRPRRSTSASVAYLNAICSPQATRRPVSTWTGTCGRPTPFAVTASGTSRSSPGPTSSVHSLLTAAGLSPASRAMVLRATGP